MGATTQRPRPRWAAAAWTANCPSPLALALALALGCSSAVDLGRATPLHPVRAADRGAVAVASLVVDFDLSEPIGGAAASPGRHYVERYYWGDATLPGAVALGTVIARELSRAGHPVSEGANHRVRPHLQRLVVNQFGQSSTWAQALVVVVWETGTGVRQAATAVAESSSGPAVAVEDAVRFACRRLIQDAWAAGSLPLQAAPVVPVMVVPTLVTPAPSADVTARRPTPVEPTGRPDSTPTPTPVEAGPSVRRGPRLSDAQIRKRLIRESRETYPGNCPCPYDTDSIGRRCGGRSAWSRDGGYSPLCYARDIPAADVGAYREALDASAAND